MKQTGLGSPDLSLQSCGTSGRSLGLSEPTQHSSRDRGPSLLQAAILPTASSWAGSLPPSGLCRVPREEQVMRSGAQSSGVGVLRPDGVNARVPREGQGLMRAEWDPAERADEERLAGREAASPHH